MAISEACQVWIEQRIEEALEDGDNISRREMGRIIADEIKKYFETDVSPETIRSKIRRIKGGSFDPPQSTTQNHSGNGGNGRDKKGRFVKGSQVAGRKPKYIHTETFEVSDAMDFATMAISQLERIDLNDPHREDALNEVEQWIIKNRRIKQ